MKPMPCSAIFQYVFMIAIDEAVAILNRARPERPRPAMHVWKCSGRRHARAHAAARGPPLRPNHGCRQYRYGIR
jgi:hypothetical protein